MKHSPAPWTASQHSPGDKFIAITGKTNWYGMAAVALVPCDDCDHDEARLNAQLIATAPELLFALERCAFLLIKINQGDHRALANAAEAAAEAMTAIIKAGGEDTLCALLESQE